MVLSQSSEIIYGGYWVGVDRCIVSGVGDVNKMVGKKDCLGELLI